MPVNVMRPSMILIVEDDSTLREVLEYNLKKEGYETSVAADGPSALDIARKVKPDVIILDIMLPLLNGLEVCRILRNEMDVPVIMLTAKVEEVDRVIGLEIGADDYVTKPFSMRELLARIKAVLRRTSKARESLQKVNLNAQSTIVSGNIRIDNSAHKVYKGSESLELSPMEFKLLTFLMINKGQVFSRETILQKVWGYDYIGNARTVDVHIRWLRQKLEQDAETPVHLLTVRGFGYKFDD